MDFKIGEINSLVVTRQTDIGYMLENEESDEVFIHNNQVKSDIVVDDTIDVFIFFDSMKRLTATMEVPFITVGNPGFVKVKNVVENLGVFIDINILKDMLISSDDLPNDRDKWPVEDDTIFCKLKNTGSQLIAKIVQPKEVNDFLKPESMLNRNKKVEAIVIKSGEEGINLLTREGHIIFVYYKHKRRNYHIGEEVQVTITNVININSYNGTLLESKLDLMNSDAEIILEYLKDNDGYMPFNTKSDVRDIEETFNMSKATFKRALSNLYKQRIIEINEKGTTLLE